jgi:hypothetical protein
MLIQRYASLNRDKLVFHEIYPRAKMGDIHAQDVEQLGDRKLIGFFQ